MITAIDSNILLDHLSPGSLLSDEATEKIAAAGESGPLVISEPVWSEVATWFRAPAEIERFLRRAKIALVNSGDAARFAAGHAWREYSRRRPATLVCPQCGAANPTVCVSCGVNLRPRQHVLADFMIGAHALHHADQLLTRDRGFYGSYFPELRLA